MISNINKTVQDIQEVIRPENEPATPVMNWQVEKLQNRIRYDLDKTYQLSTFTIVRIIEQHINVDALRKTASIYAGETTYSEDMQQEIKSKIYKIYNKIEKIIEIQNMMEMDEMELREIPFKLRFHEAELEYKAYINEDGSINDIEARHPETGAWNGEPLQGWTSYNKQDYLALEHCRNQDNTDFYNTLINSSNDFDYRYTDVSGIYNIHVTIG